MTRQNVLLYLERVLLATGIVLALYCGVTLVRAEYVRRMPIPPPTSADSASAPSANGAASASPNSAPRASPNSAPSASGNSAPSASRDGAPSASANDAAPSSVTRSPSSLPGDAADDTDLGEPGGGKPLVTARLPTGAWIARLEAPTARLQATILEGTDDHTLARAAGHIEDTAYPGQVGNIGVAGHRDTIFRPVRALHVGDPLVLTTADFVFRYRISKTAIVKPDDVWVLDPAGHPTLTLVTCYPFEFLGHAPKRFIVSADLVSQSARTSTSSGR